MTLPDSVSSFPRLLLNVVKHHVMNTFTWLDKNRHGDLYSVTRALSMCIPLIVPWAVHPRGNGPQCIPTFSMETGKFFFSWVDCPFYVHATRYSVLPALMLQGYIYADIVHGSFNGDSFKAFLTGLLQATNPYPERNSMLVMDNCAIHHVEGVQEMCDER